MPISGLRVLPSTVGKEAGFSLHAGVAARAHEREKMERLCRYVSRPPVAESRLSLTSNVTPAGRGKGSAAADEAPTIAGKEREEGATPAQRMTWAQRLRRVFRIDVDKSAGQSICTAEGCRVAVGYKDLPDETCPKCGGTVKIIASIEEDAVIEKILAHVDAKVLQPEVAMLPPSRASPRPEISEDWQ